MQTKAAYRRKAAILVELMTAQRNEGGTASEAFMQQLSAFRVDVDEAMMHMLSKRLEAAQHHEEVIYCRCRSLCCYCCCHHFGLLGPGLH
jgi:hypothetical protein